MFEMQMSAHYDVERSTVQIYKNFIHTFPPIG